LFPAALALCAGAFAAPPPEHPMAREPENQQSTSTLNQMIPRDEQTTNDTGDPTEQAASNTNSPTSDQAQAQPAQSKSEISTSTTDANVADQAAIRSSSNSANPEQPKSLINDTASTNKNTTIGASASESPNISVAAIKANFDAFDKGGKGYITREEAASDPRLSAQFDTLDADHDGRLSITEYMSARNVAELRPKQGLQRQ